MLVSKINQLMKVNPDISFLIDKNGTILYSNDLIKESLGYEINHLVNRNLKDYFLENGLFDEILFTASKGESVDSVLRIIDRNKRLFTSNVKFIPIIEEDSGCILVTVNSSELNYPHEFVYKILHFLESSNEVFSVHTIDGIIRYVSPAGEKLTGYKNEEIVGKNIYTYIHKNDREKLREVFKSLEEKGKKTFSYRFLTNDGTYVWKESSFQIFYANGNKEILGISKDITEKKKSEELLRQNEKKYRELIEEAPFGIFIFFNNGTIRYVNETGVKLLGSESATDVVGKELFDFLHEDDLKVAEIRNKQLIEGKKLKAHEYKFIKSDGKIIDVETYTYKTTYQGQDAYQTILTDITEKKRAEEMIKQSEERYRLMIEKSPLGILIYTDDREIIYTNEATNKIMGASNKHELIGKNIFDYIHKDYKHIITNRIKQLESGEKLIPRELKVVRIDGEVIDVEVIGYKTTFQGQSVFQGFINDITEKKKMRELAMLSEKLNTVGQLAAGMAHEIRNPLTSINGFLQLIRSGIYEEKYFDIMKSELDKIEMITSSLLMASKPTITNYKKANIQTLVSEVIDFLGPQTLLDNIIIKKHYDMESLYLYCDANQIKQVLINIIKNGMEAMPKGGKITIDLERNMSNATIRITDNGIGIPEENIKKIGEPFFTTKENGTGLGMMVSFLIIENHKGKIHVSSKMNQGTTFEISLPLFKEHPNKK